jgi:Protein of unknown function (DUF998)
MAVVGRPSNHDSEANVMTKAILNSHPVRISIGAARVSLVLAVLALASLAGLHVLSPEFDPSRRAVSEYALGRHGWLLSLMFISWALSSWALAFAIRSQVTTIGGRIGLILLVVSGLGEAMASVFDVRWPALHGVSALLGVPSLPIAAMLISVNLGRNHGWLSAKRVLLWTANFCWMSLALMAAAILTASGKSGNRPPLIGWSNRLLIAVYCVWVMTVAWQAIRLRGKTAGSE